MTGPTGAGGGTMRPEDDPGWAAYARTVLRFDLPGTPSVNLALPLSARELAVFRTAGLPGTFGLLTPENPRGRTATVEENDRRWASFRAGPAAGAVRVDGCDPGGGRCERGVALPWTLDAVRDLAIVWEQSAIYWYDGRMMWVVGALTSAAPWPLGGSR
ncbi:MAG TPA: hypothetical protein PLI93_11790 [Gemmatimonadales bacterium]|nr:hypothetical protein [Gemmatimonadales bacterium]MCB9519079.1 hypothetical protein [Gemmatimonadales bacterium]HPF62726.1 hypothetical protein [Gemmatimonadales bacterium]HRX18505.1 hypothetical protein [Gemmatimonadales bacterium]